jgi:hypothetical protein
LLMGSDRVGGDHQMQANVAAKMQLCHGLAWVGVAVI